MKNEKYKRLYILESYVNAVESTIDARMADKVSNWAIETGNLHPDCISHYTRILGKVIILLKLRGKGNFK